MFITLCAPWQTFPMLDEHQLKSPDTNQQWASIHCAGPYKLLNRVDGWEYRLYEKGRGFIVLVGGDTLPEQHRGFVLGLATLRNEKLPAHRSTSRSIVGVSVPWIWRYSKKTIKSSKRRFESTLETHAAAFTGYVYFDYLLDRGVLVSDSQQTANGRALWESLVKTSIERHLHVYFTDYMKTVGDYVELKSINDLSTAWQPDDLVPLTEEQELDVPQHTRSEWENKRIVISKKSLISKTQAKYKITMSQIRNIKE